MENFAVEIHSCVFGATISSIASPTENLARNATAMGRSYRQNVTVLLVLQEWSILCQGFTTTSSCLERLPAAHRFSQRHAAFSPSLRACSPFYVTRRLFPRLPMASEGGEFYNPYRDEPEDQGLPLDAGIDADNKGLPSVQPYREEHTAGGSRFSELLARAKGETPARPKAVPRRPMPPETPVDYEQNQQWDDESLGSPELPDMPLKNEMPGLSLSPEIDYDTPSASSVIGPDGGRFQRMMQQAQINDQRQTAGISPAGNQNPPPLAPRPRPPTPSKEERERALKAAVERQQKVMAKARGIDLEDTSLDGPELARKKALSRAQAEATTGGYVPSASSSEDYLAALKNDSKRKNHENRARLKGDPTPSDKPIPTMQESDATVFSPAPYQGDFQQDGEFKRDLGPQRRTKAVSAIKNSADVYMASLKGIKVEIPDNPHMAKDEEIRGPGQQSLPEPIVPPPMLEPTSDPKTPKGPSMSYADRLKLAREAKIASTETTTTTAAPGADSAPSYDSVSRVPTTTAVGTVSDSPQPTVGVRMSYAEKLKQAREAKEAGIAGSTSPNSLPTRSDGARSQVETARATPVPDPASMRQVAFGSADWEDDDTEAKIREVMDLLTEHKTVGLVGEDRVVELRKALVEMRDYLRAEMRDYLRAEMRDYLRAEMRGEQAVPWRATQMPINPPIDQPRASQSLRPSPDSTQQEAPKREAPPTPLTEEDKETLRRCSILMLAHEHASLAGQDLVALHEALTSCLKMVEVQLGYGANPSTGEVREEPNQSAREAESKTIPDSVGGVRSIGGIFSEMSASMKPNSFQPENDSSGQKGWTSGNLGEYEKRIGTKALGYLLKHRGGKGYGRGRVRGTEAEDMVSALAELVEIFQEEMVED